MAIALINPLSGGVGKAGAGLMAEALQRAGLVRAQVIELEPADLDRQIAEYVKAAPDFLVVWGGDGTLRAALRQTGAIYPSPVLLPGGTMNLLVRWIYGERPWDQILADVVASPKLRRLPGGRIGDEDFYCAMLAGAPARLADARESMRRGDVIGTVMKSGVALDALTSIHMQATYRNGYDFSDGSLPTSSVIGAMVGPLAREGGMEVAALADASATSALNMVWSSFTSDWRDAPSVRIVPASSLMIEREEDEPIPIILDGESMEFEGALHVTYVEDAAQCLTSG